MSFHQDFFGTKVEVFGPWFLCAHFSMDLTSKIIYPLLVGGVVLSYHIDNQTVLPSLFAKECLVSLLSESVYSVYNVYIHIQYEYIHRKTLFSGLMQRFRFYGKTRNADMSVSNGKNFATLQSNGSPESVQISGSTVCSTLVSST